MLVAHQQKLTSLIKISKVNLNHSPFCLETTKASSYAVQQRAAPYVECFKSVGAQDIIRDIKASTGIKTSLTTAWRAVTEEKQRMLAENAESFAFIEDFLDKFSQSNPGTLFSLERAEDGDMFKRSFLCPHATKVSEYGMIDNTSKLIIVVIVCRETVN
jgi:hypothetical protein